MVSAATEAAMALQMDVHQQQDPDAVVVNAKLASAVLTASAVITPGTMSVFSNARKTAASIVQEAVLRAEATLEAQVVCPQMHPDAGAVNVKTAYALSTPTAA